MPRFSLPKILLLIFFLFLLLSLGVKSSFAQVYPTPTPPPGGYCGDTICDEQGIYGSVEACDICVPDCGTCQPPGTQVCETGVCPDGREWQLYCEPSCDAVPRTCYHNNSCTWPPDNCNEYGGDDWCAQWVSCGPGTVDCTIPICGAGGNCYADCTYCDGGTPPPDYTPPPEPTPSWCIPPTTPTLSSPANGTETPPDIILVWNPVVSWGTNPDGNVNTYRAYLDTNPNPSTLRCDVGSGITFCSVSGLSLGTNYYWKVIASNGCESSESAIWSLTVQAYPSAWFQTKEGDVHSRGSIYSSIPTNDYFCLKGDGGTPGVVSYGNDYDFKSGSGKGDDRVSEPGWLANTDFSRKKYEYFYQLLGSPTIENFTGALPTEDGVYYAGSDRTLSGSWTLPANRKIIILVDGKVDIPSNIDVPAGSFLAIIASGNINVANSVSQVEGVFISDLEFNSGTTVGTALTGEGMFIANSFSLGRDLEDLNETTPAEKFIFRPDFWLNAPDELLIPSYTWQELAP